MRKLLSLALALTMAAGMSINAYAANKAVGFAKDKTLSSGYSHSGDKLSSSGADLGEIYANDKVERQIHLYKNMFVDADGKELGAAGEVMSSSDIRSSKIAVRHTVRGNSKVLKSAPEITSKGLISIKFATEWASTKSEDFEVMVYLTIDGKRCDNESFTLTGTMGNQTEEVYSDQDYIDISDGRSITAEESVSKIELDLGEGVSIFTKLIKGKTYYGSASRDVSASDETVFTKYADLVDVFNVKVVGLNSTGDIVKLNTDYEGFVYDKDMKYVGKTSEMLPLSTKYYVATKKLDVLSDDEPDDSSSESESEDEPSDSSSEPDDESSESSGGNNGGGNNGGSSNQIGNNPDTGANNMLGIAVMAAVLSLAAGVVVWRRK